MLLKPLSATLNVPYAAGAAVARARHHAQPVNEAAAAQRLSRFCRKAAQQGAAVELAVYERKLCASSKTCGAHPLHLWRRDEWRGLRAGGTACCLPGLNSHAAVECCGAAAS